MKFKVILVLMSILILSCGMLEEPKEDVTEEEDISTIIPNFSVSLEGEGGRKIPFVGPLSQCKTIGNTFSLYFGSQSNMFPVLNIKFPAAAITRSMNSGRFTVFKLNKYEEGEINPLWKEIVEEEKCTPLDYNTYNCMGAGLEFEYYVINNNDVNYYFDIDYNGSNLSFSFSVKEYCEFYIVDESRESKKVIDGFVNCIIEDNLGKIERDMFVDFNDIMCSSQPW